MSDDWFIQRIEEYLDGDLSADEREEMERRLAAEPELRAEVEEARSFRALALKAAPVRIPEDLGPRIHSRVEALVPAPRGRIVMLRTLVTGAVAAAVVFMLLNPIGPLSPPDAPSLPVAVTSEPEAPALTDLLADWLDQARNAGPEDAQSLMSEARQLDLLARVRGGRPAVARADRLYWRAAEDLLIQMENGLSPDALPAEAGLVAMARRGS